MKLRKLKKKNLQTDTLELEEKNLQTDALMLEDKILQTHSVNMQCDPCGETFERRKRNNHHQQKKHEEMRKIERELEIKINLQRMQLTSDIMKLKDEEDSARGMCMCKTFCRIFHKKHNWYRSTSQELVNKLENLQSCYSCNLCDKTFFNVATQNLHMTTTHGGGERESGEII